MMERCTPRPGPPRPAGVAPNGRFLPRATRRADHAEPRDPDARRTGPTPAETVPSDAVPGRGRRRRRRARRPTDEPPDRRRDRRHPELPEDRFLNRELSWLDFNARVLALAEDPGTPLLERAKFLAIFASNLDEFYMVRVAGLKRRLSAGLPMRGGDRCSLRNQLEMITERAADLVTRHAACFADEVLPEAGRRGHRAGHAGASWTRPSGSGCAPTSGSRSSRCSPRSRSTRRTRSRTSRAGR